MAAQEVKLLGLWVSPYTLRVEWALKLKGVDYEYIEEDIFNKSNLLLELNPVHKKVPVLVHKGKAIAESFVILEYVDETWKQYPLLPQDPCERAMARFWAKFAQQKLLEAAYNAMLFSEGEEKERALTLSIEALEKIEGELRGKDFFGGETIGYLDIAVGWISYWLPVWEEVGSMQIIDPVKFPATTAWSNKFVNHPLFKDSLPPRDKMLVYFHNRRKKLASMALGWIKTVDVDETWKQYPLLPQDPYERAMVRFWAKSAEEKGMLCGLCSQEEEKERALKLHVHRNLGKDTGKDFFGGEIRGYLDIEMGWISYWLSVREEVGSIQIIDPVKFPATTAWTYKFVNHASIDQRC